MARDGQKGHMRPRGQRLAKAEKDDLAEKALAMNVKGQPFIHIGEVLGVERRTAKKLVDYALSKRDVDQDRERERSIAHHQEIIRWCWEQATDPNLREYAQNKPALIARIQESQAEIDKHNGIATSARQDINVSYHHYATGPQLAVIFEEIERDINALDADSYGIGYELSVDSEETGEQTEALPGVIE